jgi:hypothetical protein
VPPAIAAAGDRPAGEAARDLDDVLLRVAAVDAEGVELEELARVVLVEARRWPRFLATLVRRGPTLDGRALRRGAASSCRGRRASPGCCAVARRRSSEACRARAGGWRCSSYSGMSSAEGGPLRPKTLKWLNQKSASTWTSCRSEWTARMILAWTELGQGQVPVAPPPLIFRDLLKLADLPGLLLLASRFSILLLEHGQLAFSLPSWAAGKRFSSSGSESGGRGRASPGEPRRPRRRCVSGWSWSTMKLLSPMLRTRSTSPGRGPYPRRFRTWTMRASPRTRRGGAVSPSARTGRRPAPSPVRAIAISARRAALMVTLPRRRPSDCLHVTIRREGGFPNFRSSCPR